MWNSEIEIAGHKLKNRIMYPPLSSNWAEEDGSAPDKLIELYRGQAQGGVAAIVVEGTAICQQGKGCSHSLMLTGEQHLAGFSALADAINAENCFSAVQLMHAGGQANPERTGMQAVSPSGVECKAIEVQSRALSLDQVKTIRDQFIYSAELAYRAGFKAVELHLAHGYLLHEFLSQLKNKREDQYGGDTAGKLRLHLEIIEGIRQRAPDLIVGVRVSGEDYLTDGITQPRNAELLPILEQAGVEYFSVTAGIYETAPTKHERMAQGEFFSYAHGIKSIVSKPVVGVGKVLGIEQADQQLLAGNCDMVAIGRGLLADPHMVKRALQEENGKSGCIECHACMYLKYGRQYLRCPIRRI